MLTTESTYAADLAAARELMSKFVARSQADGNGAKWSDDTLNDSWQEGLTIEQWVARAVSSIPAGFRG